MGDLYSCRIFGKSPTEKTQCLISRHKYENDLNRHLKWTSFDDAYSIHLEKTMVQCLTFVKKANGPWLYIRVQWSEILWSMELRKLGLQAWCCFSPCPLLLHTSHSRTVLSNFLSYLKAMANYPQELAQDAVCQSHTGHMTGLWFLPAQLLRLNTN